MSSNRRKPWTRPGSVRRLTGIRERRKVLILCEDQKSSCLYFEGFQLDPKRVQVLTVGTGRNTDGLVRDALERKRQAERRDQPFNEIWCVFDRDSFPAQNFNRALELAETHGIRVAWSNEAFELWYLLHFSYHDTGISRREYGPRLSKLMKKPYDKADSKIYQTLLGRQGQAVRNALKLERSWLESGGCNPEKANPSTSVHRLVARLNEFLGSSLTEAS